MRDNVFVKATLGLGLIVLVILIASLVYLRVGNLKRATPIETDSTISSRESSSNYIRIHAEKDSANSQINLIMTPIAESDNAILINAVELDLKIFGDNFEKIDITNSRLELGTEFGNGDWVFPISDLIQLETGEVAIKLAGYFSNKDGFNLNDEIVVTSFDVTKLPENPVFVSEFVKDNTHFYTNQASDQIPFSIE
jgi:hypothetical protein